MCNRSSFAYLCLCLLTLCSVPTAAFAPANCHGHGYDRPSQSTTTSLNEKKMSRRNFFTAAILSTTATITATVFSAPTNANAAVISSDNTGNINTSMFQSDKTLGVEYAKERFIGAMADIDYLLEHYADISKDGGGDNVRRYLGTVGVTSRMYGMRKVLRELREEADDIVEFTETANDFEAYWNQAEGAAYQSLFVEHSSAKGTPESFLKLAKKDVESMRKYMGDLADQLHLQ